MGFTVKTDAAGIGGADANAIDYAVRWHMNKPCEAEVIFNDVNFASLQKYTALAGDVYFGHNSYLAIEDPTNTEIFRGPIYKTQGNPDGTVTMFAKDWLYQLACRKIDYETRLDLDGSGLRESHFHVLDTATPRSEHVFFDGAAYLLYDDDGDWANDAFNNDFLVFNAPKMGGSGSLWLPVMGQTETTGTFTNDFDNTFEEDDTYYQVVSAAAGGDLDLQLHTYTYVPEAKVTRIDLDLRYTIQTDDATGGAGVFTIELYDFNAAGWYGINLLTDGFFSPADSSPYAYQEKFFQDITARVNGTIANAIDADGEIKIRFFNLVDAGDTNTLRIYYARFTIHYEDVTPITTTYTIDDTFAGPPEYLELSEDMKTAGVDKHAKYSITKVLTHWVADLVTTYDVEQAIDVVTDLVASTNKLARHYRLMSPLEILEDFAEHDGTEFWLDTDFDLHWNSAYATGGAPNITDASVLYWMQPHIDDHELVNDVHVVGQSYSDDILVGTSTDGGSQAAFGVYSRVVHDRDLYHQTEADTRAAAIKDRCHDPRFYVGYAENGLTSRVLGEVIEIDSTDLNLTDKYYIVTAVHYHHREGVSKVYLTPRHTAGINVQKELADTVKTFRAKIHHAHRSLDTGARHTETWT